MTDNNLEQNIQQNVLEKIRGGRVQMRSKAYFVGRLGLAIFVALLVLLVSVFVVSFVFFSIHESGEQFLLGFSGRGILTFFLLFPWLSLLFDMVLLVALEWLLQSFRFGYRISLLTIFLGIVACSTVLGGVLAVTPLHPALLDEADRGALPLFGEMYERIHDSHADRGVFRGTILSIQGEQGDEIRIAHDDHDRDGDDGMRTIILPPGHPPLSVGDRVYILGSASGTVIEALGVERFAPKPLSGGHRGSEYGEVK